jgi:hypothetical protein
MKEKPEIYMLRKGDILVPEMAVDAQFLRKKPEGVRLRVTATQPRSVPYHRRYWAILASVIDACGLDYRPEDLHTVIKIRLGMVQQIKLRNGDTHIIPDSTAFEEMDQSEFMEFFEKAMAYLIEATCIDPVEIRKAA